MPTASGIDGQVMYATESVYGTPVAVTRGIPHVDYSVTEKVAAIESKSVTPGKRTPMVAGRGQKWVEASMSYELAPQGLGFWAVPMLGAVSTSGAGPYVHTITPGDTEREKSRTLELHVPSVGTSEAWKVAGAFLTKASLGCKVGEIATVKTDLYGKAVTRAAPTAFSGPAGWQPFTFANLAVTMDAAATAFDELSIDIETGLQTGRFVFDGTGLARAAKVVDFLKVSGSLSGEYIDSAYVTKYLSGATAELVATFDAGASAKLVISATIQFGETRPEVKTGAITRTQVPWMMVRGSSETDAQAITMVLTNSDSTP